MHINVLHHEPGKRDLVASVIDTTTGQVWDPQAKAFGAGSPASFVVMPRVPLAGLDVFCVAYFDGLPQPPKPDAFTVALSTAAAAGGTPPQPVGTIAVTFLPVPTPAPALLVSFAAASGS